MVRPYSVTVYVCTYEFSVQLCGDTMWGRVQNIICTSIMTRHNLLLTLSRTICAHDSANVFVHQRTFYVRMKSLFKKQVKFDDEIMFIYKTYHGLYNTI